MNEKRLKLLLILPLLAINLFNIVFIIYKARGTGHFRETGRTIIDYFIGFHLVPLLIVFLVLLYFYLSKKISLLSLLYKIFLVLLLFFTATNISLFPEIMELRGGQEKFTFNKKNSSLKEAIWESPAKDAGDARQYIQMNEYLKNKNLTIPHLSPVEKDYYFKSLIKPNKISKKEYSYEMAEKDFEVLKNYRLKSFTAFRRVKEIKKYLIVDAFPGCNSLILFAYDNNYIFIPSDLLQQHPLSIHD